MDSERVRQRYDRLAAGYDAFHKDAKSLAEDRWAASFLREILPPQGPVVDLGCGTGLLLELHPLPSDRYFGVDLSEGMLAQARRKHPSYTFLAGDMQRPIAGLPEGRAAAVVSLFGAPSYSALGGIGDQCRRLLAPGGRYWLMFCGPRYSERRTYIDPEGAALLRAHRAEDIRRVLEPEALFGLGWGVDALPESLPPYLFDAWLRWGAATLGRALPESGWFLNAVGRKAR